MPRVNIIKKAKKNYPEQGIKKGDTYYWWKFRYGGKHKSKTYPKRSQLTQSSFLATIYDIEDSLECPENLSDLESIRDEVVSQYQELIDEQQSNLDNMPQQLQDSSMLRERIDELENAISSLEGMIFEKEENEDEQETIQSFFDELTSNLYSGG